MRGRTTGVQSQIHSFNYYFGVYILQFLLKHSDNLSKAFQNSEMLTCECQMLTTLSIKTLEKMFNDSSDSVLDLTKRNAA